MEWCTGGGGHEEDGVPPSSLPIISNVSQMRNDWKPPHGDSGQNSLEYWDYTMELEMLNGPQDLQLAAELGKTLLERNRELESTIKHQSAVIDDQTQEIEYLSKQTAALREVNDSRLRIYEQLEISIQDLEKTNQRLAAESNVDKRKLKSLNDSLEQLESRNDEVQKSLEETRAAAVRGRTQKRRSILQEEAPPRRSVSCENNNKSEDLSCEDPAELRTQIDDLKLRMKKMQVLHQKTVVDKEDMEVELACVAQENHIYQEQLRVLREKEVNTRSVDDEIASIDDSTSSRLCRKCQCLVEETMSTQTMQDITDDIEDMDPSIESTHGECALIKLRNGGYAWGSQESLASMGQVVNRNSIQSSPRTETSEAPHNSLLSELDTQYRILIEKYEALLEAREVQQETFENVKENRSKELTANLRHLKTQSVEIPDEVDFSTEALRNRADITMRCQRCTTCTCDLKPHQRPTSSNHEEFSEVETSSSGFSDGESRLLNRGTQTEGLFVETIDGVVTPTPQLMNRWLDLTSPVNPCDTHFQSTPEYKKLFQEIFTVLKKTIDENEAKGKIAELKKIQGRGDLSRSIAEELLDCKDSSKSDESLNSTLKEDGQEESKSKKYNKKRTKRKNKSESSPKESSPSNEEVSPVDKPARPAFLELTSGCSSRSSSKQRRRKRKGGKEEEIQSQGTLKSGEEHSSSQLRTHESENISVKPKNTNENSIDQGSQGSICHGSRDAIAVLRDSASHGSKDSIAHVPQDSPYKKRNAERELTRSPLVNPRSSPQEEKKHFDTKVIYNTSVRPQCEHRSRKTRNNLLKYKDPREEMRQKQMKSDQIVSSRTREPENAPPKINYPSVEVAKLLKLEMSYAEALKKTMQRNYERKY